MATAKTPKTAPAKAAVEKPAAAVKAVAPKPVAPKPVLAKAAAPKPVAAKPAAVAKPAEKAVIKAVEEVAKPAEKVAVPSAVTLEEVTASATKAIEAAAKDVAAAIPEPVKAPVKEGAAKVVVAAKKAEEKVRTGVETFLEFGRDNAILLVSAGNDFALGFHKLSLSLIDWSAVACDKGVAGASALMSAKTVEEVVDLSQSLAQDGLQHLLKEGSELGSLSTKLVEETLVPLPGRLVAAVEKLASHAA
jgi:hypothetical protein